MTIHTIRDARGEFFKILETTAHSQVGVMTIPPGGDSGPEEIHLGDQIIYIITGETEVEVDRERKTVSAGELIIIPARRSAASYLQPRPRAALLPHPLRPTCVLTTIPRPKRRGIF